MEKNEKLPTITPQQQLWNCLKTYDQKKTFASELRHLKQKYQEDLALNLVAYLRFGIVRRYPDDFWLDGYLLSLLYYIRDEKDAGRL